MSDETMIRDLGFDVALALVQTGSAIRRAAWPTGQRVQIALDRLGLRFLRITVPDGTNCTWLPSGEAIIAQDWMLYTGGT